MGEEEGGGRDDEDEEDNDFVLHGSRLEGDEESSGVQRETISCNFGYHSQCASTCFGSEKGLTSAAYFCSIPKAHPFLLEATKDLMEKPDVFMRRTTNAVISR